MAPIRCQVTWSVEVGQDGADESDGGGFVPSDARSAPSLSPSAIGGGHINGEIYQLHSVSYGSRSPIR